MLRLKRVQITSWIGGIFLISSLCISALFSYWIIAESSDEKVHRVFLEHDKLIVQGKRKEASALFTSALSEEGNGPLDPIWLPFVRAQGNGYIQLQYYYRILAADPDRHDTYKEIARLIETAPDVFHREVKQNYLSDIAAIPGIQRDVLLENGLIIDQDSSKE
ncbi:MAG: hypothetical protein KZQ90_00380 [Candidatus Thiodiazotropha sp. (ex Codakia rugifera)]|nr:hypothetical protein [Candidatus Thiodiazotropha sp. (ex Codakia rugifera)]